ncbi:MAG: radical SAM protein [Fusobacteriaceae bacterium]
MGNKVYLRITNECNLSCSFCYQKEKHGKDHMTEDTFYNVISRLDKENDLICLYGGEALLNKNVFDKAINSNIKNLSLITNASVLMSSYEISKFKQIQFSYNEGLFEENILIMADRCIENGVGLNINLVFDDTTVEKVLEFLYLNEELLSFFTFNLNTEKEVSDFVVQKYTEFKKKSLYLSLSKGDKKVTLGLERKFNNFINSKLQKTKNLCSDRADVRRLDFDHLGNQSFCESCLSEPKKDLLKQSCDYCPVECNIQACRSHETKRTSEVKCKNFRVDFHIDLSVYLNFLKGEKNV